MQVRALIIDDEDLARNRLRKMLSKYSGEIEIVGEAGNGEEAVEKTDALRPDVIFLDVQMPPFDGFEVVRRVRQKPFVVFTTAFDEYALKAFEENSVDYLLKPIDEARLERAVQKLRRILKEPPRKLDENVERLLAQLASPPLKRIQVKSGDRIFFIDTEEIVYFEAKDKYTFLHTAGQEHIIDLTLAELEDKLDKWKFVRVHRSAIVNVDYIKELIRWFGGKYKVRLKDKAQTELVVSRGYADRIQSL